MKLGAELFEYKGKIIQYFYAMTDTAIYVTLDSFNGLSSDEQEEVEAEIRVFLQMDLEKESGSGT